MMKIGIILHILLSLLIRTDGESIISSVLEQVVQQDWSLSSTSFDRPSASSIVAYDSDEEKVIIFGGFPNSLDTSKDYWVDDQTDWNITYIYDIKTDKLFKLPFNFLWDYVEEGNFVNYATTNAIVMQSRIYFALEYMVIAFDLSELYLVENTPSLAANIEIEATDILDPSQDDYYGSSGCVATDGSNDYFYLAGTGNKNVIICSLSHQGCMPGGKSLYKHVGAACVVVDDMLYIIGGINTNVTEYVNVSTLLYQAQYQFTIEDNVFPGELGFNDESETDGGRAVIQDDDNKLIYILGGGNGHNREIYKMDLNQQTMELLDIELPEPGLNWSTTILSQSNGKIYAFRGMNGGNDNKVAFTDSVFYSNNPTSSPSNEPSITPTNSPSNNPTNKPTWAPTKKGQTRAPSIDPTMSPSKNPSISPSKDPTLSPTTSSPTANPTTPDPTKVPTKDPSSNPTQRPSEIPTSSPITSTPTTSPITLSPTLVSKSPSNSPTLSPSNTKSPTMPADDTNSSQSSDTFISKSMLELILGGVAACLLCVCCVFVIAVLYIKKKTKKNEIDENLAFAAHDIEGDDDELNKKTASSKDAYVEIPEVKEPKEKRKKKKKKKKIQKSKDKNGDKTVSLISMVSDEKIDELYEIYCKSRLQCMRKCQEFGFRDEFLDELFGQFEKRKQGNL